MEFKEIEKNTKRLKDILITNFDYHFNKFLLQDFYEDGHEADIDTIDEYLFIEQFISEIKELLFCIEELYPYNTLPDFENYFNKLPQKVQETQIKLISLKRFTDKKLKELSQTTNFNSEKIIPLSIINIEKAKALIKKIYNLLKTKHIKCSLSEFESHFIENDNLLFTDKITWHGEYYTLTHFIYALANSKHTTLEQGKGLFIQTLQHFKISSNNNPTSQILTKNYSRDKHKIDEKYPELIEIEKILNEDI